MGASAATRGARPSRGADPSSAPPDRSAPPDPSRWAPRVANCTSSIRMVTVAVLRRRHEWQPARRRRIRRNCGEPSRAGNTEPLSRAQIFPHKTRERFPAGDSSERRLSACLRTVGRPVLSTLFSLRRAAPPFTAHHQRHHSLTGLTVIIRPLTSNMRWEVRRRSSTRPSERVER
jgi:hypothetical protein